MFYIHYETSTSTSRVLKHRFLRKIELARSKTNQIHLEEPPSIIQCSTRIVRASYLRDFVILLCVKGNSVCFLRSGPESAALLLRRPRLLQRRMAPRRAVQWTRSPSPSTPTRTSRGSGTPSQAGARVTMSICTIYNVRTVLEFCSMLF